VTSPANRVAKDFSVYFVPMMRLHNPKVPIIFRSSLEKERVILHRGSIDQGGNSSGNSPAGTVELNLVLYFSPHQLADRVFAVDSTS